VRTRGGYDPQIRTRSRFLYSAPSPKFHHPMFTRSEVIVLLTNTANKQTPLKTSNALRYATTLAKERSASALVVSRFMTLYSKVPLVNIDECANHWIVRTLSNYAEDRQLRFCTKLVS